MLCAVCLWLVSLRLVSTAAPATTAVRGTSLCTPHALKKLEHLGVLQELGLR